MALEALGVVLMLYRAICLGFHTPFFVKSLLIKKKAWIKNMVDPILALLLNSARVGV